MGSDQGVIVTINGAKTWSSWYNQPTAQFYHVATDYAFPYWAYGAQQDSGAAMAPSQSKYGTISQQDFRPLDVGGENGNLAPDPLHHDLVYGNGSGQGGPTVTREIPTTGWEQNVDPAISHTGTVWRNTWTLPLAFSPADRRSLYFAHQNIFRSRNGGETWQIVSPDLSRADEGTLANLDAPTLADDNNVRRHGVVYAIAPSPLRANLVWAGTDDGYIWVTRNDSRSWQNVTPPALTPWSKVGIIEASHFDPATAYAAVDRHRLDDYKPYIYRTTDYGASWSANRCTAFRTARSSNVVREDPQQRGLLYAGTERGIYVSFDDGARWQPLQLNLPVTSIRDIAVHGDDLVVATHGRSFWVMDDITPLRQMSDAAARAAAPISSLLRTHIASGPAVKRARRCLWTSRRPKIRRRAVYRLLPRRHAAHAGRHRDSRFRRQHGTPLVERAAVQTGRPEVGRLHDALDRAASGAFGFGRRASLRLGLSRRRFRRAARSAGHVHRCAQRERQDGERDCARAARSADRRNRRRPARAVRAGTPRRKPTYRGSGLHAPKRSRWQSSISRRSKRGCCAPEIIGGPLPDNPDDSMGAYSHDFTSLYFLGNALDYLESAVESADAAPTPDMRLGYERLAAVYRQTLERLNSISAPGS